MTKTMTVIKLVVVALYVAFGVLAFTAPAMSRTMLPMNQKLVSGKEQLVLSSKMQMSLKSLATGGGALNFSCNGIYCACHGDVDCNDMFTTNACGAKAICIDDYCYCSRP